MTARTELLTMVRTANCIQRNAISLRIHVDPCLRSTGICFQWTILLYSSNKQQTKIQKRSIIACLDFRSHSGSGGSIKNTKVPLSEEKRRSIVWLDFRSNSGSGGSIKNTTGPLSEERECICCSLSFYLQARAGKRCLAYGGSAARTILYTGC